MRVRRAILALTALVTVAVVAAALLLAKAREGPEVRLCRLARIEREPSDISKGQYDWAASGMSGVESQGWRAEFVIRVPPESGMDITNREIGVEILGSAGHWTTKVAATTR